MQRKLQRNLIRNQSILWAIDDIQTLSISDNNLLEALEDYKPSCPRDKALANLIRARIEGKVFPWDILKYTLDPSFIPTATGLARDALILISKESEVKLTSKGITAGNVVLVGPDKLYKGNLNLEDIGLPLTLLENITGVNIGDHYFNKFVKISTEPVSLPTLEGLEGSLLDGDLEELIISLGYRIISSEDTLLGLEQSIEGEFFSGTLVNGKPHGSFRFQTLSGIRYKNL